MQSHQVLGTCIVSSPTTTHCEILIQKKELEGEENEYWTGMGQPSLIATRFGFQWRMRWRTWAWIHLSGPAKAKTYGQAHEDSGMTSRGDLTPFW